jgi:hypothetical protein
MVPSSRLKARSDVHSISVDGPVVATEDVAKVDADAELHLPVLRELQVAASEFALNFDGALHRLYRTVEFRKNIIARRIHDATFVPIYKVAKDRTVFGQCLDSGCIVILHET